MTPMTDGSTSSEQAEWLDSDEMTLWLHLSGLLFKLPAALDAQLQRDSGLSYVEYMVLAMLSEREDRSQRMSELAAITGTSLSRLSHLVSRLERAGYVSRTADPTDGRYTLAVLHADGWDKVVASAPGHVTTVRDLVMAPLSPAQVKRLADLVAVLFEKVDPSGSRQVQHYLARLPGGTDG